MDGWPILEAFGGYVIHAFGQPPGQRLGGAVVDHRPSMATRLHSGQCDGVGLGCGSCSGDREIMTRGPRTGGLFTMSLLGAPGVENHAAPGAVEVDRPEQAH